jgi:hypothetical protein
LSAEPARTDQNKQKSDNLAKATLQGDTKGDKLMRVAAFMANHDS